MNEDGNSTFRLKITGNKEIEVTAFDIKYTQTHVVFVDHLDMTLKAYRADVVYYVLRK